MGANEFYMSLPHDIAGSRTKNRFRIELLWGVSKLLDLFDAVNEEDFTVVFDFACDIEVHFSNGFEFYQIKTHSNEKSLTGKNLTKIEGKNSILGKLYLLTSNDPAVSTKLAVVSNSSFNDDGKIYNDQIKLSETSRQTVEEIVNNLQIELKLDNIDLSHLYFLHSNFNFNEPENEVLGKICISFQRIMECEPQNPNALYKLIYHTVSDKACYEYSGNEYNEVIKFKGLSKKQFEELLRIHSDNAKTGIKQTEQYIDELNDIQEQRKLKRAFPNAIRFISSPIGKEWEVIISKFLIEHFEEAEYKNLESAIIALKRQFHENFTAEISQYEEKLIYILIVKKHIEGAYDHETDI